MYHKIINNCTDCKYVCIWLKGFMIEREVEGVRLSKANPNVKK